MKSGNEMEDCRTDAALYCLDALSLEERCRFEQRLKSGCPFCLAEADGYAHVLEELAALVPAEQPDGAVRDQLFARIGAAAHHTPENIPAHMKLVRATGQKWQRLPFPGVEVRPLLGKKTLLVRMQPGAAYPSHEHAQAEQCYVLEGSIQDDNGITARAGDFVCMAAGSTHGEIRTETGCVFLIAYTA
jgi:anti-sigma factor ChrR (cupin superfamily)